MISYTVLKEGLVGDTRIVLSKRSNGDSVRFELTAYSISDPQGGYKAERRMFSTFNEANHALKDAGVVLADVGRVLYDPKAYIAGAEKQPKPDGWMPLK